MNNLLRIVSAVMLSVISVVGCKEETGIVLQSIELSQKSVDVAIGDTLFLDVVFFPSEASGEGLIWESSDPKIVRVTGDTLLCVGPGNATIKVATTDGRFSDECKIGVVHTDDTIIYETVNGKPVQLYKTPNNLIRNDYFGNLGILKFSETLLSVPEQLMTVDTTVSRIILPSKIKRIDSYAFDACYYLREVLLPDGLEELCPYSLAICGRFTEITLPASLKHIHEGAFFGCFGLKRITLPYSIESIGIFALKGCKRLEEIRIDSTIPPKGGGEMFDDTGNCPIVIPKGSLEVYGKTEYWKNYTDRFIER